MQWLITARTPEGRFAYLGFTDVWYGRRYDAEYNATKVYTITDRPVYRPEQKVQYKFWVRHAQYDMADTSEFADREFTVEIYNPKGEKVVSASEEDRRLRRHRGRICRRRPTPRWASTGCGWSKSTTLKHEKSLGGGSFRVEEYKKPEFEVTVDAPTEPVMLGEKITATIKAKYYFGSPVTKAKVKYTVNRTSYNERWYPAGPWDWFYGPGYWWFAYDYDWYPGWRHWGCPRPVPFWWPRRPQPPELVADQEVEIGPDGTVKVEIDTGRGQGHSSRPGPQLHDHRRGGRPVAADDRRHGHGAGGPASRSRSTPGSIAATIAWATRSPPIFRPARSTASPVEGNGELRLLQDQLQGRQAGRDARADLAARHQRRRRGPSSR